MRAAITLLIVAFAAASGAALGQATSSGIGAGTGSSATGGSTGLGIPNVPNNRLPPLPGSTTPGVTIELSPPISNAPGSSSQIRTCPGGLTYC